LVRARGALRRRPWLVGGMIVAVLAALAYFLFAPGSAGTGEIDIVQMIEYAVAQLRGRAVGV